MPISTKNVLLLLLGLTLLALLGWLLWVIRPLLVALIISGLLAYLLNPLLGRLERRLGGRRPLAATIVYVAILALFGGLVALLGAVTLDQWPLIERELLGALAVMQGWWTRPFFLFGFELHPETLLANLQNSGSNALSTLTIGADGLLGNLTDNLLWGLVVFVSLYYLLKDGQRIQPQLLELLPPRYQPEAQELLTQIDKVWGVFLRVQLLIFAVLAVLLVSSTTLIIWLFRQGWLPLSPIGLALLLVGVYAAIQQVDNLWLRPQLMGHALKLHPGIIFVGLIAGLALSGLLGALLIVPVLATAKVIGLFVYVRLLPIFAEEPGSQPDAETQPPHPEVETL